LKPDSKILVVDDENELRMLIAERLSVEGYQVAEASRVSEAIELLSQSRFDLLLLDVRLPDGTGLDILRHMENIGLTTPVVMLTGMSGLDIAVESVKLGARDYVTKPAKISYLLHTVKEQLRRKVDETQNP
jgi:DNA-binding response OmpR family regulator